MTDTRFAPGATTAYITDHVLALSSAHGIDHELMHLCATITEWNPLLDAALDRGVTALVMHDGGRVHLAVCGDASIVVETSSGERRFEGTDTRLTDVVEQGQLVRLAMAGQRGAARYRTDGGVVPASLVCRRLVDTAPASDAAIADPFELLFGPTVIRSVESAAVRPAANDRDEPAVLGVLVFDTGDRVVVDRTVVLGRNPRPHDNDGISPRPRLVKLTQPGVSRRHVAIRLDRWTATIEDLGSTNGTTVAMPGRPAADLRARHPVELPAGAVVDLGGEVSFVLEEAA